MKIGILTLPFNNNYGGLLQAYALQTFLKQQGHEVYVIQKPFSETVYLTIKGIVRKLLTRNIVVNSVNMFDFQHSHLNETNLVYTDNGIKKVITKYALDAVVVGSDQVWRYSKFYKKYKKYFLKFAENLNIKKIAFAVSFGVDYWEADSLQTQMATRLIKKFDIVSVRERTGIDLCKKYLNYNNAFHLLDPTLLHNSNFYRILYDGTETDNSGKFGAYILDFNEQTAQLIHKVEEKYKISSFVIGRQKYISGNKTDYYYPKIAQWIKDFDTAKYIITDSFHGMLFAIIFRKPFLVIGNVKRGLERFRSLLEKLDLQDRLLISEEMCDLNYNIVFSEIDYYSIKDILNTNILLAKEILSDINI
jgi:menaquinone-dependent protoporphyrinogen IX oxidase